MFFNLTSTTSTFLGNCTIYLKGKLFLVYGKHNNVSLVTKEAPRLILRRMDSELLCIIKEDSKVFPVLWWWVGWGKDDIREKSFPV